MNWKGAGLIIYRKEGIVMNRRNLLKGAAVSALAVAGGRGLVFAKEFYPVQVNEKLFTGINRLENPENESELEKLHVPIIHTSEKVKAGEIFPVDVSIGKILHPMGPTHWIETVQINIGNEPAGTLIFRSHGCMKPEGRFNLLLRDNLKGKTVSLVIQDKCNLHGIWQSYFNVEVI
jgi:superoxide reductase